MAFVTWKDDYGVGVASVDDQHKKLFSLLNVLEAHVRDAAPEMEVERAVTELEDYTRFHFADEERVLGLAGITETGDHKKQHSYFVTEIAKTRLALREGKTVAPRDLVAFLRDWLVEHILVVDRGAFNRTGGVGTGR